MSTQPPEPKEAEAEVVSIKTGPVRTSGYALKLRRAVNAAFRDKYKEGKLEPRRVNELVTQVNRVIYEVLVDQYRVPKEAVVNISLDLEVSDGDVRVRDLVVEVWERDDILSRNATQDVRSKLGLSTGQG